jgi:DNA-directed RNA polymerase III subunit RPC2
MKLIQAGIFGPLNGLTSGPHASGEMVRNLVSCGGGLAGEFVSVYCTKDSELFTLRQMVAVPNYCRRRDWLAKKQFHMESMAVGTMDVRDLLRKGIVEYVDCNEENNTLIAVTERDLN